MSIPALMNIRWYLYSVGCHLSECSFKLVILWSHFLPDEGSQERFPNWAAPPNSLVHV